MENNLLSTIISERTEEIKENGEKIITNQQVVVEKIESFQNKLKEDFKLYFDLFVKINEVQTTGYLLQIKGDNSVFEIALANPELIPSNYEKTMPSSYLDSCSIFFTKKDRSGDEYNAIGFYFNPKKVEKPVQYELNNTNPYRFAPHLYDLKNKSSRHSFSGHLFSDSALELYLSVFEQYEKIIADVESYFSSFGLKKLSEYKEYNNSLDNFLSKVEEFNI